MWYRSYGLVLTVVAVLVAGALCHDDTAWFCLLTGGIMLVDLPFRWLGSVVPWRSCDDDTPWAFSAYRGSQIYSVPTWLFGAGVLAIAFSIFGVRQWEAVRKKVEQAETPGPPRTTEPVTGKIDVVVQEVAPFDGNHFRYTVTNRTGVKVKNVVEESWFPEPGGFEGRNRAPVSDLEVVEIRSDICNSGGNPDWVRAKVTGKMADDTPIEATGEWKKKK